jgi:hypothetical protein
MAESLRATNEGDLVRVSHEQALALFQSGTAIWGELLRAQLQIAQSMFTIGCAWALGARPKDLPLNGPRSAALKPPPVTPVAKARRARGRKRGKMRAP